LFARTPPATQSIETHCSIKCFRTDLSDVRFLLYINDVIPEDEILDAQSLPKVKMPIGDGFASLPEWKPRTRRLQGYPY
jgi:hypothetical protein